jgi:hypothetical protein
MASIAPIWTGSLRYADRHSWSIDFEDDQERYMAAHNVNRFTCSVSRAIASHFGETEQYDNENDRKLCDESKNLRAAGSKLEWRQTSASMPTSRSISTISLVFAG